MPAGTWFMCAHLYDFHPQIMCSIIKHLFNPFDIDIISCWHCYSFHNSEYDTHVKLSLRVMNGCYTRIEAALKPTLSSSADDDDVGLIAPTGHNMQERTVPDAPVPIKCGASVAIAHFDTPFELWSSRRLLVAIFLRFFWASSGLYRMSLEELDN